MPTRSDGPRPGRAAKARRFVSKVAGRGASRPDPGRSVIRDERPGAAPTTQPAAAAKSAGPARRPEDGGPAVGAARETFFRVLDLEGDVAFAAAATVREHMRGALLRRARTFAQILQQEDGRLGDIGDICMAIVAGGSQLLDTSWRLFTGADLDEVLRVAAAEYFRVGFAVSPDVAGKTLEAVARGELTARADATGWLEIACAAFAARAEEQSQYALGRARAQFDEFTDERAGKQARAAAGWLEKWYGRLAAAATAAPAPTGEIPFAVASFRHPDRAVSSRNLGDYLESVAALSHLARRRDVQLTGDRELVAVAEDVRARVDPNRAVAGDDATVRLHLVDRDATSYSAVPDGTWFVVSGLLPRPMWRNWADLPMSPRLRPLFTSVHVDSVESLTPEVLDHLRRCAPIGCSDWPTTFLLLAAGVPAFFAGALTGTLGAVRGAPAAEAGAARLFVDVEPNGPGDTATLEFDAVRNREPVANLRDALGRLADYRGRRRVVTSQLQTYLAARAVGTEVRFQPENPAERRFDGLAGMDDAAFTSMHGRLDERLADVLGVILSGASDDEVYARWRSLWADGVAEAEARRADVPEIPRSAFDIADACATILGASSVIERSAPGPAGSEINVELSLDGNYKHQLEVVLDSIVEHASRPVRAFVLCRDHTRADYDRLAALFPTVSFVWLPTDGVDYGAISGLLGYTTVATMDRLLLPDLLPQVSRIVHHDLDALCLGDLAELFDVELGDAPLAGRESPLASLSSGFAMFMRQAERYTRRPELGQELLRRTHGRHSFDFSILNAGIMVLNLDRMRADNFGRHFVPFVERFGMNDQAVLNAYAGGSRVEVAPGWNWRPWLEYVEDPKIAHWAGRYKPWSEPWVFGKPLWQQAEARLAARYTAAGLRQ